MEYVSYIKTVPTFSLTDLEGSLTTGIDTPAPIHGYSTDTFTPSLSDHLTSHLPTPNVYPEEPQHCAIDLTTTTRPDRTKEGKDTAISQATIGSPSDSSQSSTGSSGYGSPNSDTLPNVPQSDITEPETVMVNTEETVYISKKMKASKILEKHQQPNEGVKTETKIEYMHKKLRMKTKIKEEPSD